MISQNSQAVHDLPRENVSRRKCGNLVWDPDLKRRILELERPAIQRFYPE